MRINLDMSPMEMVIKMSGGNPGAISVCSELLKPNVTKGIMLLCKLDDMELYESKIWLAYKDVCGSDIEKLREKISQLDKTLIKEVLRAARGE